MGGDPKVALVTGANRGIGFATARALGKLNYRVLVGARDAQRGEAAVEKLRGEKIDAHLLLLNKTDETSLAEAAAGVEQQHHRLDALVNNAAMMDYENHIIPLDISRMREEFDANFFSVVAVTNAFLPLMLRTSPAPRVVNVSTPLGTHETVERPQNKYASALFTSYKCTKSALNMYTHNLAQWLTTHAPEVGGNAAAAKVNAAYPGYVKTEMSRNAEEAPMNVDEGAETSVYLATLPEDGPTGGFFHKKEQITW